MENEKSNLEKNLSRLVKLAGDPDVPARGFADSLVEDALRELGQAGARPDIAITANGRIDRIMRVAAAIAIVGGAAVQILLSGLAWAYPALAQTLLVTMSVNWFCYVGRLII